jgi:serine/threonine protein kinase
MDKSFIYVALEPFVALPLVAGQQATSLTLKHVVQQSSTGDRSIGRAARIDVLRQVADGLHYLHSNNLVHRDVKPMNVLVRPRQQGSGGRGGSGGFVAKLSDLEFAKELGSSSGSGGARASTFAGGTKGWQAPEVFMEEANSKGSDIFSLGLMVYFVCTDGGHALGAKRERTDNLMRLKYSGSSGHLTSNLDRAGPEAADLVGAMLVASPVAGHQQAL